MKEPQPDRHQNIAMIAGVALFVAAIAAGVTWWRAAVDTEQLAFRKAFRDGRTVHGNKITSSAR